MKDGLDPSLSPYSSASKRLQPMTVTGFMGTVSLAGDQCFRVQRPPEDDSHHPWDER